MSVINDFKHSNSKFIIEIPEETFIKIFGYVDAQTLGRISSVCKYFNNCGNLWTIQLGSKNGDHILDLRNRIITVNRDRTFLDLWKAMNYPAIPKGSFAVYPSAVYPGSDKWFPCAVIKNQKGKVTNILDVMVHQVIPIPEVVQLRNQIGKSTEYFHFTWIHAFSSDEESKTQHQGRLFGTGAPLEEGVGFPMGQRFADGLGLLGVKKQ